MRSAVGGLTGNPGTFLFLMKTQQTIAVILLIGVSVFGMVRPLLRSQIIVQTMDERQTVWPARFMGEELIPISLSEWEQGFYADFPGDAAQFQVGAERLILRKVNRATRKLHPARDCFKGMGYEVKETGLKRDGYERVWNSFRASKKDEKVEVFELITDESENAWSDVSAWYWAVISKKTEGPWTSFVRVRSVDG